MFAQATPAALQPVVEVLQCDRVAPLLWLARRYEVDSARMAAILPTRRLLSERGLVDVVALSAEALQGAPGHLMHLAYLAILRAHLGAAAEDWQRSFAAEEGIPDALWRTARGGVAVEVDIRYAPDKVTRKVRSYSKRYPYQIWGTPSRTRLRFLRSLLGNRGEVVWLET